MRTALQLCLALGLSASAAPFRLTVLNPECCAGGAGLCVVMQTPEGRTYLYDTANGEPSGVELRNNGREIVVPWLLAHGIKSIDGLVISHGHNDHVGGLHWMYGNYPFRFLWDNGYILAGTAPRNYTTEMGCYHKIRDEWAAAHPDRYRAVQQGDLLDFGCPDLKVEVVWPPKGFVPILENDQRMKGDGPEHHLENANAIALQLTYRKIKFFIVGDIQEDYLKTFMVKSIPPEKWRSDICLMLSHGIHASEVDARLIRPKVAIAGIGDLPWMFDPYAKDKRCYEAVGANVYVSNRTGDITVETDGETFSVTTNPCALVRTREWAQMPGDVTLDGWVKNLERYSRSRVARRWCEAETMERYARAETDVKVYLANGDAAALARARTVQSGGVSDWLQVPPRALPPFLGRPVLESDVTDAWLRLNFALLRATGENRYVQAIDAVCRALRTQEVAPETLALLRTCVLTLGQQTVFFNLYTDFSTGRLNVSAPWRFMPEISVKTDYPTGGRVTLALRHPAKDLRGAIPLKFMVPADRPVWKVTGLEHVKHTAKVDADGYLAVSAAWPTDVTFTVEFQPASK